MLYGFSFTRPGAADLPPTFVVAGAGELPEGKLSREAILALGDTSPAGLDQKARLVMDLMESRLQGLGGDWSQVSHVDVYTVHSLAPLWPEVLLGRMGPAGPRAVQPESQTDQPDADHRKSRLYGLRLPETERIRSGPPHEQSRYHHCYDERQHQDRLQMLHRWRSPNCQNFFSTSNLCGCWPSFQLRADAVISQPEGGFGISSTSGCASPAGTHGRFSCTARSACRRRQPAAFRGSGQN